MVVLPRSRVQAGPFASRGPLLKALQAHSQSRGSEDGTVLSNSMRSAPLVVSMVGRFYGLAHNAGLESASLAIWVKRLLKPRLVVPPRSRVQAGPIASRGPLVKGLQAYRADELGARDSWDALPPGFNHHNRELHLISKPCRHTHK